MKVAIIDYNAGNIRSVIFALERLGVQPILTADIPTILSADKVIFPGQGEARSAMQHLRERGLDQLIPTLKQPFLGICIGMQLLCAHSEENDTPCLGVIPQQVRRFPANMGLKVPHVGWNTIHVPQSIGPFSADLNQSYAYFVHSYYVENGPYTTAMTDYGLPFSACLQKDNFYAAQFHPEKSGQMGAQLIQQFLEL